MSKSTLATVQMVTGPDRDANLRQADELLARAAAGGAKLAVLPENFALMGRDPRDKLAVSEDDGTGPIQDFLAEQAAKRGLWIVGGTVPIRGGERDRVLAACPVYDDRGERRACYHKIHLFDVDVAGDAPYRESDTLQPGAPSPVVVDTPFGRLGLAVCYDLRFPELFRHLSGLGMEILALPAAFTYTTGEAHWRVLLRARAIENLCYVVASAQGGEHADGRRTWGDSLLIDPWGRVLHSLAQGPGVIWAEVDTHAQAGLRQSFPCLAHRRMD
ncbi:carbon-nitrogen hydrolase family protein [Alkalilimnicola sp. S0819]|uniref:carbon-nitrogen hydrolase family protein n=1 Tax=Alkalilimnicola sp. S0819 TaxID=2613922 RepID=UPI0012614681|nr:carbon-nitrogen hydrolase family protein [Alkalilimnicola sp. S0819]KAB7628271.1 carbon-nitrogen hydrolase family protein [Alkalilimnicola sp. S0819]MPQ15166.1 carbon-nitrogen hydrolase family protein [Alkalilimnicola sp. S0819]